MSKRKDGQPWGKYTLEFKLEEVRLAQRGAGAASDGQGALRESLQQVPNAGQIPAPARAGQQLAVQRERGR